MTTQTIKFLDVPEQLDLFENGLNQFGQSPLIFTGGGVNQNSGSAFENALPANFITSGSAGYNVSFTGTMLINDKTNDRVLLGKQTNGF